MRHGFKALCERRSLEIRRKFGLPEESPLSGAALASERNIVVWYPSDVAALPINDLNQLTVSDPDSWFGLTIKVGNRHLILVNSSQSLRRRNSVIMHELAHIELGHQLTDAGATADGMLIPGNYNQEAEDEANWLAGALLLPRPALMWMRQARLSDENAADHFSVSTEMLRWRIRMTGIDLQYQRWRRT